MTEIKKLNQKLKLYLASAIEWNCYQKKIILSKYLLRMDYGFDFIDFGSDDWDKEKNLPLNYYIDEATRSLTDWRDRTIIISEDGVGLQAYLENRQFIRPKICNDVVQTPRISRQEYNTNALIISGIKHTSKDIEKIVQCFCETPNYIFNYKTLDIPTNI